MPEEIQMVFESVHLTGVVETVQYIQVNVVYIEACELLLMYDYNDMMVLL